MKYDWAVNKVKLERVIKRYGEKDEQLLIEEYTKLAGKVLEDKLPSKPKEKKTKEETKDAE